MRINIFCEPKFVFKDHKISESYLEYTNGETKELLYRLIQVSKECFEEIIKKYGEYRLISIEDIALDESVINWYDMDNHQDVLVFKTDGFSINKINMILFKESISAPAMASIYYVNTVLIDRYKEK